MQRRKFLMSLMADTDQDKFEELVENFDREWTIFFRRYCGCIHEGDRICNAALSTIDRKQLNKARNLAKKLFDLND